MPGKCPQCGGRMMKRTGLSKKTNKQYTYYCCEHRNSKPELSTCDFMTFDVPTKDNCPACSWTMFKKSGKGFKRPYCINPACERFVPEEKRGFTRKKAESDAEESAEKKTKKTTSTKTTAKKTTTKTTKPAAKKTTAKTAVKKTTKKEAKK